MEPDRVALAALESAAWDEAQRMAERRAKQPPPKLWRVHYKGLWVPVSHPERGAPWPLWSYVRSSRKAAREAYLAPLSAYAHAAALQRVTFERVELVIPKPIPKKKAARPGRAIPRRPGRTVLQR